MRKSKRSPTKQGTSAHLQLFVLYENMPERTMQCVLNTLQYVFTLDVALACISPKSEAFCSGCISARSRLHTRITPPLAEIEDIRLATAPSLQDLTAADKRKIMERMLSTDEVRKTPLIRMLDGARYHEW